MTQFFKPKKQPGRPGKKTSQAGRPTTEKVQPSAAEAVKATTGQPKTKKLKKTKQNWSKSEGLQRMTEAVSAWNEELSKPENERLAMRQVSIISTSIHDLTVKAILKDAGGEGATKRLAQRKLNNAGAITNHCGLQNSPARIKKLLSTLELTASLAEINALTTGEVLLGQNQTRCFQVDQERDLRTVFAILWCVTQGVEPKAVAHIWLAGTDHRSTS